MARNCETLRRYASYLRYGTETFLLRRKRPYLFILVIDDACNLNCFYCSSQNSGLYELDFGGASNLLKQAYSRGHRALVITGGEPLLWRSNGKGLEDVVNLAAELGFVDIAVFTNGTFPLGIKGCRYIVTVDGTREIHESIRPGTYDLILEHARDARGSVMASVTLTRANAPHLEATVESIAAAGCFRAITFNLLTHRPEVLARLGVCGRERQELLERIWELKRSGHPIMLSRAALKALSNNSWKRPIEQIELGTKQRVFTCCRDVVHPEVCENCGYSSCVEISQILCGRPSAWLEMLRVLR
jgi:Fe-coproporphyrin III synthase